MFCAAERAEALIDEWHCESRGIVESAAQRAAEIYG